MADNEIKKLSLEQRNYQYANQLYDYYFCHNANISKGSRQIDCITHIKMMRHECESKLQITEHMYEMHMYPV